MNRSLDKSEHRLIWLSHVYFINHKYQDIYLLLSVYVYEHMLDIVEISYRNIS